MLFVNVPVREKDMFTIWRTLLAGDIGVWIIPLQKVHNSVNIHNNNTPQFSGGDCLLGIVLCHTLSNPY